MNHLRKIKVRKNLEEYDGQYTEMAEALERVMPFDTEGDTRKVCSPLGLSQSKLFPLLVEIPKRSCPPSGLRLLMLAVQPLYIPLTEEAPWNDLLRGLQLGLDLQISGVNPYRGHALSPEYRMSHLASFFWGIT